MHIVYSILKLIVYFLFYQSKFIYKKNDSKEIEKTMHFYRNN